jgi:hypothetical protein
MGNGIQPSADELRETDQRVSREADRRNQLAQTQQWEADGMHLLRAAAFHGRGVTDRCGGAWGE